MKEHFLLYVYLQNGKTMKKKERCTYDVLTMESSKFPVIDPFSDICPLMEIVLPLETLNLASLFLEDLDSFRNVTYESEVEESEWEVDDDSKRELEGDSENNSDKVVVKMIMILTTIRAVRAMRLKMFDETFCCYF